MFPRSEALQCRASAAFRLLREEKTAIFGSHPSLHDRIEELGGNLDGVPEPSAHPVKPIEMDSRVEDRISIGFATESRPTFYRAKRELGRKPTEGLTEVGTASYVCRHAGCERKGAVELTLSQECLTVWTDEKAESIRWIELKAVEVGGGGNFIIDSGLAFLASLRRRSGQPTIDLSQAEGRSVSARPLAL